MTPEPPRRVWLMRHAETRTPTVFHGAESDVDLSALGVRQAEAAAGWFEPLAPTAVVSSGMLRARATAAPIADACGVAHAIEPGLHERAIGPLAGRPFVTVGGPWEATVNRWSAADTAYTTPDAESYDQVRERTLAAWHRATAHPGGAVAVVAHGIVCKVLLLTLLRLGPTQWAELGRVPNVAVAELVPDGDGWRLASPIAVPTPVLALNAGRPTGLGAVGTQPPAA